MKNTTKYVGLDVSKDKIAVAIADEGREAPRYYGTINHDPDAVRRLMRKLTEKGVHLEVCYEAGPTGYELYRWITGMKINCVVVAPSRIPVRPGDRVKTDRLDAERLAQLHRSGELTEVFVPSRDTEALRDLVRAREDVKNDVRSAKQRAVHFLLRHHVHPPQTMKTKWSKTYRAWLARLVFDRPGEQVAFQEYLHTIREGEERLKRLEAALVEQVMACVHAPVIRALQGLRGVALLTAVVLVAEIGSFARFRSPAQLMAYLGLVPRERSTGLTTRRGQLTKAGNSRVRSALVEAAWSYRYRPSIKRELAARLEGQSAHVQEVSWKAQNRLHKKYLSTITAVSRELVGFVWAIAVEVERGQMNTAIA